MRYIMLNVKLKVNRDRVSCYFVCDNLDLWGKYNGLVYILLQGFWLNAYIESVYSAFISAQGYREPGLRQKAFIYRTFGVSR